MAFDLAYLLTLPGAAHHVATWADAVMLAQQRQRGEYDWVGGLVFLIFVIITAILSSRQQQKQQQQNQPRPPRPGGAPRTWDAPATRPPQPRPPRPPRTSDGWETIEDETPVPTAPPPTPLRPTGPMASPRPWDRPAPTPAARSAASARPMPAPTPRVEQLVDADDWTPLSASETIADAPSVKRPRRRPRHRPEVIGENVAFSDGESAVDRPSAFEQTTEGDASPRKRRRRRQAVAEPGEIADLTDFDGDAPRTGRRPPLSIGALANLSRSDLARGLIVTEILGQPLSLRDLRGDDDETLQPHRRLV